MVQNRGVSRRPVRVRRLAHALQVLLKPTEEYRPVIGEEDRRKIEILVFGMDRLSNLETREAMSVFGIVKVVGKRQEQGHLRHRAWIVQPKPPHELDGIGEDLDDGDTYTPVATTGPEDDDFDPEDPDDDLEA